MSPAAAPRSPHKALCRRIERVRDRLFEGEEPVIHLIERIVGPLGLRVEQASPWVDARLRDGSGVQTRFSNALIGPKALLPTCRARRSLPRARARASSHDQHRRPRLRGHRGVDGR